MTDVSLPPLGSTVDDNGAHFRVWAPHATAASVLGDFNDWKADDNALEPTGDGQWVGYVAEARDGQEYRFEIVNGDRRFSRIDPYAREVTNSIGNGVLRRRTTAAEALEFARPRLDELVIYEMHVGTFNREAGMEVGTFDSLRGKLDYLAWLGVNALEIMPAAEFAGDLSWGYNPAHIFAIEGAYGGPDAFRRFVGDAHEHGIAVLMDVVYNHFGPSDLDIWQFDGWSENEKGGIYFYNDHRSETPWGDTRPDYGRPEVRQYIRDNARMWIEEYGVDGLRYDMTLFMRSTHGEEDNIEDGWTLAQWINDELRSEFPDRILIAEDLRSNRGITQSKDDGGACFHAQWDEGFVHPVRAVLVEQDDASRDMHALGAAITNRYNDDAFQRVVYTESHDEVANGKQRLPSEIDEADPTGWQARRRSVLGAMLVFTAPGIPMIFQGQEFLRDKWFDDARPIDWEAAGEQDHVTRLYRDLVRLRLNRDGHGAGLTGQHVELLKVDDESKLVAFRRWRDEDPNGEVLVILNVSSKTRTGYRLGIHESSRWSCRFDTGAGEYGECDEVSAAASLATEAETCDGREWSIVLDVGPYRGLIYTRSHD